MILSHWKSKQPPWNNFQQIKERKVHKTMPSKLPLNIASLIKLKSNKPRWQSTSSSLSWWNIIPSRAAPTHFLLPRRSFTLYGQVVATKTLSEMNARGFLVDHTHLPLLIGCHGINPYNCQKVSAIASDRWSAPREFLFFFRVKILSLFYFLFLLLKWSTYHIQQNWNCAKHITTMSSGVSLPTT